MKRAISPKQLLAGAVAAASLVASSVALAGPAEPSVPAAIAVEEGNKLFLVTDAVGVQIYRCNAVGAVYRWDFVAPRADLFEDGKLVGTHFGGPTWQARDGSYVKAALDARTTVDPTAIDWLRLRKTQAVAGPDGGRFAGTTFIQRIETTGGLASAAGTCGAATVGSVAEVPYTAVYAFWKASGGL